MSVVGVWVTDKLLVTQVDLFLSNFKRCAVQGKIDYSEVKPKTTKFLRTIGWTNRAMNSFILENVEPKHYFRGPSEHHHQKNRTVMEFGMVMDSTQLYVKLELIIENEDFVAGYMSFHHREQKIEHFPLDKTGEVE